MEPYDLRISDRAVQDLRRLDSKIGRRIANRIRWLASNIENIQPMTLASDFAGLCKFRFGDYRVIYGILRDRRTIVIHAVGHRRDVYRP